MNHTVRMLMLSDIFVLTGFGLITPILAIFIKEDLAGGSILAAGIASTIFLITKCSIQLPFSKYIDAHKDKVKWLVIGTILIVLVPFVYIFSKTITHVYLAQILYGIGAGLAYPTWLGLWSTHLDRKHESFEWSLYSTSVGIGTAITAIVGAAIANYVGFNLTFGIAGIVSLGGLFILFKLEKQEHSCKIKDQHYHIKRKLLHRVKNH
ncbi:MAG: MFS transporter [Nanoarchaeota archaeon]|nr:MFS transporter [Nanoarchaeota archaeon]